MKLKSIVTFFIIFVIGLQITKSQDSIPRTITVSGYAEMEIEPDIVYLSIQVQEYMKNKKKVDLTSLENMLILILDSLKIDSKNLKVENIVGYKTRIKRKKDQFLNTKNYTLKLEDVSKLGELVESLSSIEIKSIELEKLDHSKVEEFKKELYAKAMRNAKEKADIILAETSQKRGLVIEIKELGLIENGVYESFQRKREHQGYSRVSRSGEFVGESYRELYLKSIVMKYELNIIFEIK